MKFNLKLATVAAACALTSFAHAGVAFDANFENDTTATGAQGATADSFTNNGRVELNATATAKNGDNYIMGKGTLIVGQNGNGGTTGNVGIDDAWLKLGNSTVDLQIGRFEATDLFPLGKDTLVSPALSTGYKANTLRGRTTTTTSAPGHMVLGVNAGALRAELGAFLLSSSATAGEIYGLRPTVSYTAGALKATLGLEAIKTNTAGVKDSTGLGLTVGYALSSANSINVNYARNDDTKLNSIGLNGTFGDFGVGYVRDSNETTSANANTVYAAYSFPLMGIKGATITPAISSSTGTGVQALQALRVRLNYGF